jgi:hypothetical protein
MREPWVALDSACAAHGGTPVFCTDRSQEIRMNALTRPEKMFDDFFPEFFRRLRRAGRHPR